MDDVVQFFTAHPDFYWAVKSMYHEALSSRDQSSSPEPDNLIRHFTRIINIIADTSIDFNKGPLADSTKDRFAFLNHVQTSLPADKALPLIWPAIHGSKSTLAAHSASANTISSSATDSRSDHEFGHPTPEFIHRLAISKDFDFVYPPELVSGLILTPWSYGTLYSIQYPEGTQGSSTNATRHELLDQLHVSLPEKVLDLGRLVVTSEMDSRSDGSSWSPSDFTVMVDMESAAKAVWLVCDTNIARTLYHLNIHDGIAEDLYSVHKLFDSQKMDLALLFPSIRDWPSSQNTWSVIESRIRRSAMNLGLRLHHL